MKKAAVRMYSMSDANFVQLSKDKLSSLDRDIAEFLPRGYTPAVVTAIKAKLTSFEIFPPDDYYVGLRQEATSLKNTARAVLDAKTNTLQLAASQKFDNVGTVAKFGNQALTTLTDEETIRNARLAYRAATEHLTDLTPKGITAAFLADYLAAIEDLDTKKELQSVAFTNRDEAAEKRVDEGNSLYLDIVDLCAVGKDIWGNTSEAKYNDYIVYDGPNADGGLSKSDTIAAGDTKSYFAGQLDTTSQVKVTVTKGTGKLTVYASYTEQNPVPINSELVNSSAPLVVVIGSISTAGTVDTLFIHNASGAAIEFTVSVLE